MKISPTKYGLTLAEMLEKAQQPEETIRHFLHLLRRRKMIKFISKILRAFEQEWHRRKSIVSLDVFAPKKFEPSLLRLSEAVGKKLGKTTITKFHADESLLGGVKIRYDDVLVDASIKNRLKKLQDFLKP